MISQGNDGTTTLEAAVRQRYAETASNHEEALCCPVDYDAQYLKVIPAEVLEKDYGCGDPSKHVRSGETVLDLGSGAGKICFIAAQVVGEEGRVIGVDFNDPMLELARLHQPAVAEATGYNNVEFRKGRIQDLRLDLSLLDDWLRDHPVTASTDYLAMGEEIERLRNEHPLVADESVDVVVSNCVLNLVSNEAKPALFHEIHRVLRRGGRCVISDIVSDEDVPERLQQDPELWSGCISGSFREDRFLAAFEAAGLYGVKILERAETPWRTVEGIEFRSLTIQAFKGKEGPCLERNQAVVYKGPWRSVTDDDGHTLYRGKRMAVCDKTFQIYTREPYAEDVLAVPPLEEIPIDEAETFNCRANALRDPRATKGQDYDATIIGDEDCCGPEACC